MTKILVNKKKIKVIQNATKIYPKLEDLVVTPTGIEQNFKSSKYGYNNVKVEAINLQDKEITLNKNGIYTITADEGFSGLDVVEITLDAIEDLDAELNTYETEVNEQKVTIEDIVETLKGKGIIEPKELTVTPTKDSQTIDGVYNKVNVAGDEDLVPENIAKGVNIFGVEGVGNILDLKITDCTYLFYNKARLDKYEEICKLIDENCENFTYMYYLCEDEINEFNFETKNGKSFKGMFQYCKKWNEFPLLDTSNGNDFSSMYQTCQKGTVFPELNTSNGTNFTSMYEACNIATDFPLLDTSNGTNFGSMYAYCNDQINAKPLNTSNGTNFGSMFSNNADMISVPEYDFGKATNVSYMLSSCYNLTNLGGFKDLGKAFKQKSNNYSYYRLDLSATNSYKKLTYESLMNVINKLYDLNLSYDVANGGTLYTQQLVLGANNLSKLTSEELSIAVNKGWTIS